MNWSPRLEIVQSAGSTNSDLVRVAATDPDAWPHLSALVAREQTAGRGRTDRRWDTSTMQAVTFSVILRPGGEPSGWGWLPLLAGLAVVRAIRAGAPEGLREPVMLKWPNDVVLVDGGAEEVEGWGTTRKLGGILAEVLPDVDGVVVGIGLNLQAEELPVPWAASLVGAGLVALDDGGSEGTDDGGAPSFARADALIEAIGTELAGLLDDELLADGLLDVGIQAERVRAPIEAVCATLGQQVRVELPGGEVCAGIAEGLDDDGGLVLATSSGIRTVYAGDVRHMRASG